MIYSQACAYCLAALCRLHLHGGGRPVRVAEICREPGLPAPFVSKIFQTLVRRGILKSTRGRGGGFMLAKPATDILIFDVVEAVDGDQGCKMCISGLPHCNENQPCALHDRFSPVRAEIIRFMYETTLQDLAKSLATKQDMLARAAGGSGLATLSISAGLKKKTPAKK